MLLLLLSERQPRLLPFSARLQWQLRKLISVGAFRFANTLYKSGNALSTPKLYPLDRLSFPLRDHGRAEEKEGNQHALSQDLPPAQWKLPCCPCKVMLR